MRTPGEREGTIAEESTPRYTKESTIGKGSEYKERRKEEEDVEG